MIERQDRDRQTDRKRAEKRARGKVRVGNNKMGLERKVIKGIGKLSLSNMFPIT